MNETYYGKASLSIVEDKVMSRTPIFNIRGDIIGVEEIIVMDKQTFNECLKRWKEENKQ